MSRDVEQMQERLRERLVAMLKELTTSVAEVGTINVLTRLARRGILQPGTDADEVHAQALQKVVNGECDSIIAAYAGIDRLHRHPDLNAPVRLFERPMRATSPVMLGDTVEEIGEVADPNHSSGTVIDVDLLANTRRVSWNSEEVTWSKVEDLRVVHRVPSPGLITSARVTRAGAHERLAIWVQGALAGELTVDPGCSEVIAAALGLREVGHDSHEKGDG